MTNRFPICMGMLAGVAAIASLAPAQATESTIGYKIAKGSCRTVNVPVDNKPVLMTGAEFALNLQGLGQVTLMRAVRPGSLLLWWMALDSTGMNSNVANAPNAHIMWLNNSGYYLDVQSADNLQLQICNSSGSGTTAQGYLTFVY